MKIKHLVPEMLRGAEPGFWPTYSTFDRFFQDMFRGVETEPAAKWPNGYQLPTIDLAETEKDLTVTAELPGVEEKDVELILSKDRLVIKGEKKEEKEERKKDYYRQERRFGVIYRELGLPCDVATEKASAEFHNGVLRVTLPKSTETLKETRKIPIGAHGATH